MKLEVSTPEKILFSGDVRAVQCPGRDGLFQVLDHHAPMITILAKGRIKYETKDNPSPMFIEVHRGVVQVLDNRVTILTD